MSEYNLEDVRDDFILHQTECSLEGYGLINMDPPTEKEARQEFDRWHQAELRRAKAEALREAADWFTGGFHCGVEATPEETVYHLRNRADRIEEDTNDHP